MKNIFLKTSSMYFDTHEKDYNIILYKKNDNPLISFLSDINYAFSKGNAEIVKFWQMLDKKNTYEYVDSIGFGKEIIYNNKILKFKGYGNSDFDSNLLCFIDENSNYLFIDPKNKYQISALISNLELNKIDRCLYDLKKSTLPKNAEKLREKFKLITDDHNVLLALDASLTEKQYPFGLPIIKENLLKYGIKDENVIKVADLMYSSGLSLTEAHSIMNMNIDTIELNESNDNLKSKKIKKNNV